MKNARFVDISVDFKLSIVRKLTNHSLLWTNVQHTTVITNKLVNSQNMQSKLNAIQRITRKT